MFPDPLALIIAYLVPIFDPIRVASRVPDPRPDELVQIRRIGGTALVPVRDRARLDVFTWATTDERAMELQLQARTHLWALKGHDTLGPMTYDVAEFLGPRLDDDPPRSSPRGWGTYEITIRADAVTPAPAT